MAIIYKNGGNQYLGQQKDRTLQKWKLKGQELEQGFMYKGFRYYGGNKDIVIVYDTERWDKNEIKKRKDNGFLGIKAYEILKELNDKTDLMLLMDFRQENIDSWKTFCERQGYKSEVNE